MDFEKFLGTKAGNEVIAEMGLDELFRAAQTNRSTRPAVEMPEIPTGVATNAGETVLQADEVRSQAALTLNRSALLASLSVPPSAWTAATNFAPLPPPTPPEPRKPSSINFAQYASIDVLGDGEAKQKIRKFQDDLQVTQNIFYMTANDIRTRKKKIFGQLSRVFEFVRERRQLVIRCRCQQRESLSASVKICAGKNWRRYPHGRTNKLRLYGPICCWTKVGVIKIQTRAIELVVVVIAANGNN